MKVLLHLVGIMAFILGIYELLIGAMISLCQPPLARRTIQQEHASSSVQSMPQVWSLDVQGSPFYSERARF